MNLHNMVWTRWRSAPPPRSTVVIAYYGGADDKPFRARTCKSGCCISAGFGCMLLPEWWASTDDQDSPLAFESKTTPDGGGAP